MGVDIATWCLEGAASSYLGDINEEELPTDLEELSLLLQHQFGKSFNAIVDIASKVDDLVYVFRSLHLFCMNFIVFNI